MTHEELLKELYSNSKVSIDLHQAEVLSVKETLKLIPRTYVSVWFKNIVVKDSVWGPVYFSSSASTIRNLTKGDIISLKLLVTGIGEPTDKYPEGILWAKFHSRTGSKTLVKHTDNSSALSTQEFFSECNF